jgi:hypothetical protein
LGADLVRSMRGTPIKDKRWGHYIGKGQIKSILIRACRYGDYKSCGYILLPLNNLELVNIRGLLSWWFVIAILVV